MASKAIKPVYLKLGEDMKVKHEEISVADIFGIAPDAAEIFFNFEAEYHPYHSLVVGKLPRVDLVTVKKSAGKHEDLRPIEIKLTTLPDNQTSMLEEDSYGCEIVVRPDSIVYLSLSIAQVYQEHRKELLDFLNPIFKQRINWSKANKVVGHIPAIAQAIDNLLVNKISEQKPFLMQPIWKTKGKSSILAGNCLDIFEWSDFAFTRLFVDTGKINGNPSTITRHLRSIVWLGAMLYDFAKTGKVSHKKIIDQYTYGTKNDKAFASGGLTTHPYMESPELTKPRVKKEEIAKIILGGGQNLLSPERRFDAVVVNSFVD
ncbi:MAG: HindVP family restriction endonuclease [Patescibacteria group bacterium]|nr:HindVP family restriction endonuclease [Patescibacteria group bacterium]